MKTKAEYGLGRHALGLCVMYLGLAVAASASAAALAQASSSADQESRNDATVQVMNSLPRSDLRAIKKAYLPALISRTKENWYPLIPLNARPPQSQPGCVLVEFAVHPDGKVTEMKLIMQSGNISMDRAAWAAITSAAPYPPFPKRVRTTTAIRMRFAFLYNEKAGCKEQ